MSNLSWNWNDHPSNWVTVYDCLTLINRRKLRLHSWYQCGQIIAKGFFDLIHIFPISTLKIFFKNRLVKISYQSERRWATEAHSHGRVFDQKIKNFSFISVNFCLNKSKAVMTLCWGKKDVFFIVFVRQFEILETIRM